MRKLLIILAYIGVCTCVIADDNKRIIIDLTAVEEIEIPLSNFVSKVEYVPLELTKECLLNKFCCIYVTPGYILAVEAFKHIYMFDRKDGHFIREISGRGDGPNEYIFAFPYHSFDYQRQFVYVDCVDKWKCIDIMKNECAETIVKPNFRYQTRKVYQGIITNPYRIENGIYVGYTNNTTGSIKEKVVLFNNAGEVFKSYPNYSIEEVKTTDVVSYPGLFYEFDKKTCFLPGIYSDTVYIVNNMNLHPYIIFKRGTKADLRKFQTIELAGTSYTYESDNNNIAISMLKETSRYVFFKLSRSSLNSCGYYDKQKMKVYRTPFRKNNDGFINDIDGLSNFNLKHSLAKGYLIDWIDASELSELNELGKLKSLSMRGKEIAEKTQYDDNPIVVIATLK